MAVEEDWQKIIQHQTDNDEIVKQFNGVKFIMSAINGIYTHSSKVGQSDEQHTVYPALSYWIAVHTEQDMRTLATLKYPLFEQGIDVKCILKESLVQLKDISSALGIVAKDYNVNLVKEKVKMSCHGSLTLGACSASHAMIKLIVMDESLMATITDAHSQLAKVGLHSFVECCFSS